MGEQFGVPKMPTGEAEKKDLEITTQQKEEGVNIKEEKERDAALEVEIKKTEDGYEVFTPEMLRNGVTEPLKYDYRVDGVFFPQDSAGFRGALTSSFDYFGEPEARIIVLGNSERDGHGVVVEVSFNAETGQYEAIGLDSPWSDYFEY